MKVLIINYACVILGIYVFFESLDPLRNMGASLNCLCHKLKYLAALAVGFWAIYSGLTLALNQYSLMTITSIALFIWPRTIWRFKAALLKYELERFKNESNRTFHP